MDSELKLISSMATKDILANLVATFRQETGTTVQVESIGGVDAARRIRAGDPFDLALLASNVVGALSDEGIIASDTIRPFANSRAALAVRAGAAGPSSCDAAAIKDLIARARSIGISTGPSGVGMIGLLQRWGVYEATKDRVVQAPPSVPVAHLISSGKAEIGFQQLSELLGHQGIDIVGALPESVLPITVFAVGIRRGSPNARSATALIRYLLSDAAVPVKRQHGMEPASADPNQGPA